MHWTLNRCYKFICAAGYPKYRSTQVSVHPQFVIPVEAGIQAVFLDSGQKIAGMTL
jgi:hypothetical protein